MKKQGWVFKNIPWWKFSVISIVGLITIKVGYMDLASVHMELGIIDYVGTICMCMVVIKIYFYIFDPECKIWVPLMWCGRNAMMILCLHGFENLVFEWRKFPFLRTTHTQPAAWLLFLGRFAIIFVLLIMIEQAKRWRYGIKRKGINRRDEI